jgi:hypothetical protein
MLQTMGADAVRSWGVRANAPVDGLVSLPEPLRVVCWRLAQLSDAGFDEAAAFALAVEPSVDLHSAADLLRRGCPEETAVRILL